MEEAEERRKSAAASIIICLLLDEGTSVPVPVRKPSKRTRRYIERKEEKCCLMNLKHELTTEDYVDRSGLKMDSSTFHTLLTLVEGKIKKQDTILREAISPAERLSTTVRCLATGSSFRDLSYYFKRGERTISYIVNETCQAIYSSLQALFCLPKSPAEWRATAREFRDRWNFPMCIGAVGGKHIVLRNPLRSNCRVMESIPLMALVDADLKFMFVEVGSQTRINDGDAWKNCKLYEELEKNTLNLPEPEILPGGLNPVPYVMVADDTFDIKPNVLKQYSSNLNREECIFNYRLSRAHRNVESAFGVLANVFRFLLQPISVSPEKARWMVLAACALHNFLLSTSGSKSTGYSAPELLDQEDLALGKVIPGQWRNLLTSNSLLPITCNTDSNNCTEEAIKVCDAFRDYFNSDEGAVFWQDRFVQLGP